MSSPQGGGGRPAERRSWRYAGRGGAAVWSRTAAGGARRWRSPPTPPAWHRGGSADGLLPQSRRTPQTVAAAAVGGCPRRREGRARRRRRPRDSRWPAPSDAAGGGHGTPRPWSRRAPSVPAGPAGRRRGACRVVASPPWRRPPRPPARALSLARDAVPAAAVPGVARPPRDLFGGCVGRWRRPPAHKPDDSSGGSGRGRPKLPPLATAATRWPRCCGPPRLGLVIPSPPVALSRAQRK